MAATLRNAGVPCSAWTLPWAGMFLCFPTLESKWFQLGHALDKQQLDCRIVRLSSQLNEILCQLGHAVILSCCGGWHFCDTVPDTMEHVTCTPFPAL